jgi:hypothetical protein
MPAKRKPTKKTTTRKAPTRSTSTRIVAKPVEVKTFYTIVSALKKDLAGTHVFVLNIPWEAKGIAQVHGAKWNADLRQHLYEGLRLPPALESYQSEDYSLERWVEDEINGKVSAINKGSNLMKPRPHQLKAIKKIALSAKAGWRGFVLADNVGLGKTISAVFGASAVAQEKGYTRARPARLLIVAPKSVIPHWRNTIKATGVDNLRVVVTNYEQSKKLLNQPASAGTAKKTSTKNKRVAADGTPTIEWDIIVADEAHKLKNYSQRTLAFGRIARYAAAANQAPFVIWASATVGQNPLEVGYIAPLISQLVGSRSVTVKDWGDWLIENDFNIKKSDYGNYSWIKPKKESTSTDRARILELQRRDVERLSQVIFAPNSPSIRRNPEDIAGWPTQTHTPTPLDLEDDEQRAYDTAWKEFRQEMKLKPRGKNPQAGLAATLRFRQKASLLRVPHTVDFVDDLLDNGLQVAISVEFIESLELIMHMLKKRGWDVGEFSGRNNDIREGERIKFQKGEYQVILFTPAEGISLHAKELLPDGTNATAAKRALVIHDVRYSSITMSQILGRTTRDGELANAYYMYAEKTIEPEILKVMLERMKNLRTLSGDDEDTIKLVESILDGVAA